MRLVNYDKGLILLLPFIISISLVVVPDGYILFTMGMLSAILFFELVVYPKRFIFGLTGIQYLSIPSIMFVTFSIFIALPSIYITGNTTQTARYPFYISVIAFYFLFPFGLYLGEKIRPTDQVRLSRIKGELQRIHKEYQFYELLLILLSLSLGILLLYLYRVDTIPLVELIKHPGNSENFFSLRENALKTLTMTKPEKYAFHWLRSLLLPVGIMASMMLNKLYHQRKYKILFITYFTLGIIVNTLTLEKSPLASIFLILVAYYYLKSYHVKLWKIIVMILLVLAGPIVITYFLFYGRPDVFKVIYLSYFNRLLIIPSQVLYYYFEYFPEKHNFLWGRSSQLFSWMSQFGSFPVANYVAKIWWNDPFTTGSANANYLGNFWSDFGYFGTLLATPIIGVVSYLFYWKILDISQYTMNLIYVVAVTVTVPVFTFGFFSSNFSVLIFTKGLFLLVIILFWIKNHKLSVSG